MSTQKRGRWTALFGANAPFEQEIGHAKEVGHCWRDIGKQAFIELDPLPGWVRPLWACDGKWLYVRRPEGVWKTQIPPMEAPKMIVLSQKEAFGSGVLGHDYIGDSFSNTRGWMRGLEPTTPMEMDERLSAAGMGIAADEASGTITMVVENTHEKYTLEAGDLFDKPPAFLLDGDWIVATDPKTGRRVVLDLEHAVHAREALALNRLWLRFEGPYLRPFDVQVSFVQTPEI